MKIIIFILFALMLCNCKAQVPCSLKIKCVDWDILTIAHVSCDNFDQAFKSQEKIIILNNKDDLDSITAILRNLKVDTSNYLPDVRVKMELFINGKISIYGLSKGGICRDSTAYILPKKLVSILDKYLK